MLSSSFLSVDSLVTPSPEEELIKSTGSNDSLGVNGVSALEL